MTLSPLPLMELATGCAALGLLQSRDGRYVNSPLSDEYLVPGKPNHIGGLVTMLDRRLHAGWAELTRAIRTDRPTTWDPTVSGRCPRARIPRCWPPSGRPCTPCPR